MAAPDIPTAKRAGLPVDLDRLAEEGDGWLTPEDRYSLKTHGVCAQAQDHRFMIRELGLLHRASVGGDPDGEAGEIGERHWQAWPVDVSARFPVAGGPQVASLSYVEEDGQAQDQRPPQKGQPRHQAQRRPGLSCRLTFPRS